MSETLYAVTQPRDGNGRAYVVGRQAGDNLGYVQRTTWENASIWDAYIGSRGHYRHVGHRTTRREAAARVWEASVSEAAVAGDDPSPPDGSFGAL